MSDDEKPLTEEEKTLLWMRRFGWLDRDGNAYQRVDGGRRCIMDCSTPGHSAVCVLGPSHDGDQHKCVECDR